MAMSMTLCLLGSLFVLMQKYIRMIMNNPIEFIRVILLTLTFLSLISFNLSLFLLFLVLFIAFPLTLTEVPTNLSEKFPNKFRNEIMAAITPSMKPFSMPIKYANGITQTIVSGASKFKKDYIPFNREMIAAPDGGEFALDSAAHQEDLSVDAPIIYILHGLAGGCREPYIQRFVYFAMERKYRIFVLTNRGCAGTVMKTPQAYCSIFFDDALQSLEMVHNKYPNAPIHLLGFSLGANTALGLASRYSNTMEALNVSSAVGISSSLFLISIMLSITPALDQVFSSFELKLVQKNVEVWLDAIKKEKIFADVEKIMVSKTMKQFDDGFTSKAFALGQPSNYYYNVEQIHHFMRNTRIPCLTLNAEDDPVAIMTDQLFERMKNIASVSPFYIPLKTKTGGHLSWTFEEGKKGYYDDICLSFFDKVNDLVKCGELKAMRDELVPQLN
ncbi:hypothetical protein EIN_312830 [Entamoeba invadens IP1]|uniref:AB hydrolase-1 domain-containing protein n=1 Tax=Entamoeba invadens IP1 TaxID=370355 RepID=A0A0A1UCE6_ENTIV|nr:hypothetical protein EIN_312830 [Entamoeba invadens IP1]ELP92911.1 hypothetical protein EIN_312830 [Entamoeba invadens IP1]|eukprot:XP_004259682.1 hypothetical protein EIN_312830 [Entamoeba invadens IP1]